MLETYLPPNRELSVKAKAVLANNNSHGNNTSGENFSQGEDFGGWLIAQMHLAGTNVASKKTKGRVEAITVNDLVFHKPIQPGDEVSCYAEVIHMNRACLTVKVEAWARHTSSEEDAKVTEGTFTYFAPNLSDEPFPTQTVILSPIKNLWAGQLG